MRGFPWRSKPPSICLRHPTTKGRQMVVMHTPDYFVIRQDKAGWEEWKTEEDLVRLAQKSPHRWRLENGKFWRCPPGYFFGRELIEVLKVPIGMIHSPGAELRRSPGRVAARSNPMPNSNPYWTRERSYSHHTPRSSRTSNSNWRNGGRIRIKPNPSVHQFPRRQLSPMTRGVIPGARPASLMPWSCR